MEIKLSAKPQVSSIPSVGKGQGKDGKRGEQAHSEPEARQAANLVSEVSP